MNFSSDFGAFIAGMQPGISTMPVLFVGHGSPMNAIEDNDFSRRWKEMGSIIPHPSAILCISAHWYTRGTHVTAMEHPKTIHDFSGFPQALYDVQYPAPGNPDLAKQTADLLHNARVGLDHEWGLDHGCWSIVKHMYPDANIPVVQLSIDYTKPPRWHYELGRELSSLRNKEILIIGSGNMVHNLRMIDWSLSGSGYDWAQAMNETFKTLITSHEHERLIHYPELGKEALLSIPAPDHYLPLLYILGIQGRDEPVFIFNDKTVMGSISMTSLKIGT